MHSGIFCIRAKVMSESSLSCADASALSSPREANEIKSVSCHLVAFLSLAAMNKNAAETDTLIDGMCDGQTLRNSISRGGDAKWDIILSHAYPD